MPSTSTALAVFCDALSLVELPPEIPDPVLHWEKRRKEDGSEWEELVAYNKFRLWEDKRQRLWRWAVRDWPDDGMPFANHGGRPTIERAITDCYRHLCLRKALNAG